MIILYLLKMSKSIKLKLHVNSIYKNERLCMIHFFHLNKIFNFLINNLNYKIKIMCIKLQVTNIYMFNKYNDSYFYVI